jgi:hypothetical protein
MGEYINNYTTVDEHRTIDVMIDMLAHGGVMVNIFAHGGVMVKSSIITV